MASLSRPQTRAHTHTRSNPNKSSIIYEDTNEREPTEKNNTQHACPTAPNRKPTKSTSMDSQAPPVQNTFRNTESRHRGMERAHVFLLHACQCRGAVACRCCRRFRVTIHRALSRTQWDGIITRAFARVARPERSDAHSLGTIKLFTTWCTAHMREHEHTRDAGRGSDDKWLVNDIQNQHKHAGQAYENKLSVP